MSNNQVINTNMDIKYIIGIIFLISLVSYTIAYTRRILVPKYDERIIIILESTFIFLFTMLFIFITSLTHSRILSTSNRSLLQCLSDFRTTDIKTLLLGSLAGSFIAIFWIYIIRYNELSNMLLTKQGMDIIFALGGSYLLLREPITKKKLVAFILLLTSIYLLSY